MASPPVSYFAWLRFQRAVGRWARLALGLDADEQRSVIWADHNVQRPPLPYLSLQVTSGPSRRAQDAEQWPRLEPLSIVVQVLPSAVAVAGDACRFFVNGELFEHLAAPGDTVTTVRNAQLARVQASVQLGATATSSGVDSIVLAADRPGSLRAEAAVGCAATVTATQLVSTVVGPREIRVRATAYGAPEPRADGDVSVAEWIELLAEAAQADWVRDADEPEMQAAAPMLATQMKLSRLPTPQTIAAPCPKSNWRSRRSVVRSRRCSPSPCP